MQAWAILVEHSHTRVFRGVEGATHRVAQPRPFFVIGFCLLSRRLNEIEGEFPDFEAGTLGPEMSPCVYQVGQQFAVFPTGVGLGVSLPLIPDNPAHGHGEDRGDMLIELEAGLADWRRLVPVRRNLKFCADALRGLLGHPCLNRSRGEVGLDQSDRNTEFLVEADPEIPADACELVLRLLIQPAPIAVHGVFEFRHV